MPSVEPGKACPARACHAGRRKAPPRRRQRGRGARPVARGFTLLEILVAMAVLAVALMTLYQSFAATLHINTVSQGLWRAIVFTHNELARVERKPAPPVSIQQGEYRDEHPMAGYAWRREVVDEEPLPGVKVRKVLLELQWDAAGVPQSYRSQIYVSPN